MSENNKSQKMANKEENISKDLSKNCCESNGISCRVEIPAKFGIKSWREHDEFKKMVERCRQMEGREPTEIEMQEMEAYTMMMLLY
jgi:hypothetical protein